MRRVLALCCLFLLALPAGAVQDGQVLYAGGTVTALKEGSLGKLDTSSSTELTFEAPSFKLVIPFAKIDSYEYSRQVAHHLGVLPAIAVGLVKQRRHKHFFRIIYRDESNAPQVAIFEVPKQMPRALLAVLQARAPHGCKAQPYAPCGHLN